MKKHIPIWPPGLSVIEDAHFSYYKNDYGEFGRPTEETIMMQMSLTVAKRSTCMRKKVGAVFTDKHMQRVLCFGYNGNYIGGPNQCDSLEPGHCGCIHAEVNALTKSVDSLADSICFVTLSPCVMCSKILINRGIGSVIYYEEYRDQSGLTLLRSRNVRVAKFSDL